MLSSGIKVKEFCTETVDDIPRALTAGAHRVELCADLSVGGTTPAEVDVQRAVRICRAHRPGAKLMVLVRPRGGNFVYTHEEMNDMCSGIQMARRCGADGVAIGVLTAGGDVDRENMLKLIAFCGDMSVTFHMAFDCITAARQNAAIEWLAKCGVHRILTHGSPNTRDSIYCNLPRLRSYVKTAQGRLAIMPGGGVTHENCDAIAARLQVSEVHGTRIVQLTPQSASPPPAKL